MYYDRKCIKMVGPSQRITIGNVYKIGGPGQCIMPGNV